MIHHMILNSKSLPLVNRLNKHDFPYNIQAKSTILQLEN